MFNLEITGLYTSLLALLFIGYSINVIRLRKSYNIGLGDGGVSELARAIRVQGNFAEYLPIALVLMGFYEVNGGNELSLHIIGTSLLMGRLLHASGLSETQEPTYRRVAGVSITFSIIIALGVINLIGFIH